MQGGADTQGRVNINEREGADRRWLPPGFRFHPTDEELITYYLARKIADESFTDDAITDLDLNQHEPWDLPGKAQMMGDKVWYFFSVKDRKYPLGCRTNRATRAGYWKATGKDKEVFMSCNSNNMQSSRSASSAGHDQLLQHNYIVGAAQAAGNKRLVGMKKTLVFYQGRAPKGLKSNWVMHEYRLHEHAHVASNYMQQHEHIRSKTNSRAKEQTWVLCRVFHKRKLPAPSANSSSCSAPAAVAAAAASAPAPKKPKLISTHQLDRSTSSRSIYNDLLAHLQMTSNVADCDWLPPLNEAQSTEQSAVSATASEGLEQQIILPDLAAPPTNLAAEARVPTTSTSPCSSTHELQDDIKHYNSFHQYTNSPMLFDSLEAVDYMLQSDGCYYPTHSLPRFPSELESLWLHPLLLTL